jgi:hypothetical protein
MQILHKHMTQLKPSTNQNHDGLLGGPHYSWLLCFGISSEHAFIEETADPRDERGEHLAYLPTYQVCSPSMLAYLPTYQIFENLKKHARVWALKYPEYFEGYKQSKVSRPHHSRLLRFSSERAFIEKLTIRQEKGIS